MLLAAQAACPCALQLAVELKCPTVCQWSAISGLRFASKMALQRSGRYFLKSPAFRSVARLIRNANASSYSIFRFLFISFFSYSRFGTLKNRTNYVLSVGIIYDAVL